MAESTRVFPTNFPHLFFSYKQSDLAPSSLHDVYGRKSWDHEKVKTSGPNCTDVASSERSVRIKQLW